ncbi:RNA-guided endonuclease InsQ/TnpB family protein [Psychromonas antarctica]|uniref:RNA-guided endonuclease InsQ/TnpB family protein n=1 Tax=Psychromonas antarctica TaxID=67573 RepID=UPI001EE83B9D|nr:transposase [Psychromonas antarctica]MCG6200528.1 transposase [Psychromonas antarctica]
MKILKAFKYKLEPTSSQIVLLYRMAGCGRVVFNDSLEFMLNILKNETGISDKKELYNHLNDLPPKDRIALIKKLPTAFSLNKHLTQWKKKEDRTWLGEAYTDNLQQRQKDLSGSASEWCKGKRGFPVFRQRKLAHHSTMRFVNFTKYCGIENRHIKLPNKLGLVKYRNSQPISGKPKHATVSLNACGEWHISIMCEIESSNPQSTATTAVGIDMGIAKNMTLSNGLVFSGVHSFKRIMDNLAKEQRKFARMVKGSANWEKQKLKIARLHQKAANIRRDYQQKSTTIISNNHAMIVVEDLKVANMSKSAKGSSEQHGKNVKQKSGLNRAILNQGWGELRRQLKYKMEWQGGIFLAVSPHHTSQTCPACLHKDKANRTIQASFVCVECGFTENADIVGAINVLNRGLATLAKTS